MARRTTKGSTQQPFEAVIEEATMPFRGGPDAPPKYPVDKLGPSTRLPDGRYKGPSFFIPESVANPISVRASVNAFTVKTRKKFRFTTRTVEENGEKGIRVWRLPDRKKES